MADSEEPNLNPSPEEFAAWIGAAHLFEAVAPLSPSTAVATLLTRLLSGLARSAAGTMVWGSGSKRREETLCHILPEWWESAVGVSQSYERFWETGDLTIQFRGANYSSPTRTVRLFDVRFDPSGIASMVQPPPRRTERSNGHVGRISAEGAALALARYPPVVAPATPLTDIDAVPNKGGRPPADFWEDLIIEIAQRIYVGDFKPEKQAEVVDAMQTWIEDRGYKGGLTQIKQRAAKVFRAFK